MKDGFIPLRNQLIELDPYNVGFNERINFDDFAHSMMVVYRMATGDGWEDVYAGAAIQGWQCKYIKALNPGLNGDRDCGSRGLAALFFVSFGIFGTMVFTNLFIAVILEVYRDNVELERNLVNLEPVREWREKWKIAEKAWRKENKLGRQKGYMPVDNFLATLVDCPRLIGLMLDAVDLRLDLDEQEILGANNEDFELFEVADFQELDAYAASEFTGKLKGIPSDDDANKKVTKDHIGAIIQTHKWHLLCKMLNAGEVNEEIVVYYDDAVFSICYLITGPEFPYYKYNSESEVPLQKYWALTIADEVELYDEENEDAELENLNALMESELELDIKD